MTTDIEELGINVIRGLAMDAPQRAGNGHPGTAMALAPLAHVLFTRVMRHDPSDPDWPDRDRFILSCGHASILLYSMLYLTGYGLTLDDIKAFRQFGSKTPGHPEVHHTKGVEVTTGPLGQGVANGVGMGMAESWLRNRFSPDVADHHTFVICSDGDLMEGVSHEAASLAGHLQLGRLVYIYDDNHITIDGPTELAFTDDTAQRFEAYGWDVDRVGEIANDPDALEVAVRRAISVEDKPSLIVLRSHIGWPAPNKTDTSEAHGTALGDDEVRATKEILGIPTDETFWVPDEALNFYRECIPRGQAFNAEWKARVKAWPGDKSEYQACLEGRGLTGWHEKLPTFASGEELATRAALSQVLSAIVDVVPGLNTGGADLTDNTGNFVKGLPVLSAENPAGRLIHYGVREHAMGAAMNGMAMHGGVIPFGGTFFVFSDYMRPAVRLAAISQSKVVFCWSHDSVGLGEDGPTHQPVEQLAAIRAIPGLRVIRPADANETAHAVRVALESDGPTALLLSRQKVPVLEGTVDKAAAVAKGAYILAWGAEDPDIILLGTGSEVSVCIEAADLLAAEGVFARVVSMPSWELLDAADDAYRALVLPVAIPTLAVEAAASFGWDRWSDDSVTFDHFGASGAGTTVLERLGYTATNVAERARQLLGLDTGDDTDDGDEDTDDTGEEIERDGDDETA
ncbi:MAG: transketolase [Actinobacteria bacterium]|nr:transketolase [Actinomycetota bacterium]